MKLANSGMGLERPRFELGMELHPDEPRVIGKFDRLRQQAVRRHAGEQKALLFQARAVGSVDLVAVAVALGNLGFAVNFGDARAWLEISAR